MTRILSLDDDPELLQRFAVALNLAGYEHLLATQSKEALSILHNERIDLFSDGCNGNDQTPTQENSL